MKFEKINENKLRITLNINDLENKNINYQSFMSNSVDTQKLFSDMLDKAEEECGFTTKNYKIMIEALVTTKGDFIITVTRSSPKENSSLYGKKVLKTKRKTIPNISTKSIYLFDNFEDFCSFCTYLDDEIIENLSKISKNIKLYYYKDNYYLLLNNLNKNLKLTKKFITKLPDFAKYVHNSEIVESKLLEYGKLIIKNNAIKIGLKYFK